MQDLNFQAQQQLAAVMNASHDAIIGVTMERVVVSWSRCAEKIYGYSAAEMIGCPLDALIAAQSISDFEQTMLKIARGETVAPYESTYLTKNEEPLQIEFSLTPIFNECDAVGGALIVVCDIAARKRTEQTVVDLEAGARDRNILLETTNRVALDILASRTGVKALRHIAEAARLLVNARYAALGVAHLDSRPGALRLREFITTGLTPEEEAAVGPAPKGRRVLGLLLDRVEPLRIDRLGDHPASVGFPPHHPPMESFLGVPIRQGNIVLGSLFLTDKEGGGSFTETDEVAVQTLAANAAVAIHHLHLLSRQRALVSGLMAAQEEERRTVAYDLHDGLTQYVMAGHAHLEAFKHAHQTDQGVVAASELEQSLKHLKEAVMESRRLINNLRLLSLEDLGLAGSLEQLLNQEKQNAGWQDAEFIHNISGRRFENTLETGVYRIVQEALTNARKHANATRIRLLLLTEIVPQGNGERLRVEVRDWGCGFVPEQRLYESGEREHVGLHGISERAHLLNGVCEVRSTPGEGTTLAANFPIPDAPSQLLGEGT